MGNEFFHHGFLTTPFFTSTPSAPIQDPWWSCSSLKDRVMGPFPNGRGYMAYTCGLLTNHVSKSCGLILQVGAFYPQLHWCFFLLMSWHRDPVSSPKVRMLEKWKLKGTELRFVSVMKDTLKIIFWEDDDWFPGTSTYIMYVLQLLQLQCFTNVNEPETCGRFFYHTIHRLRDDSPLSYGGDQTWGETFEK